MVTCRGCKREFEPTPFDAYYNNECDTDGVCFTCLLREHDMDGAEVVTFSRDIDPEKVYQMNDPKNS